jgi:hypothetical protein
MCGCIRYEVCAHHAQVIADLIKRLDNAERAGRDEARSLRGELAEYGIRAEIVRHQMGMEASR